MALQLTTTEDKAAQNLAALESKLNQSSPLNDIAFLRVLAGMAALNDTSLEKYAAERALQNLAITATDEDLEAIGEEFKTPRKQAEATVLTASLPGVDSTVIPISTDFTGDANGVKYFSDAEATISGGTAAVTMTADTPGTAGNLVAGQDTLTLGTQIPGAESTATVTAIDNTGTAKETDESYRPRVLAAIRSTFGGANSADYRAWATEVSGVRQAYPFGGKPFDGGQDSFPGDRTVYIEAETSIDPDGIAPQSLLDEARASMNTDPVTGKARPPLGITDETLFVQSIIRTSLFVEVRGLDVNPDIEAAVKSAIESSLTLYFANITMFVEGLDLPQNRNDTVTDPSVSEVVQNVLRSNGASATGVGFGLTPGIFESEYSLNPGELAKLGGVSYA
jgi:hypothetical protein